MLAAGTGFVALLFFLIWFGVIGYSPDINNLQNPISKSASQVLSADGHILGTYNLDRSNRIPVPYKKLSPYLVQALVATEDVRFYNHSGIDFIALTRWRQHHYAAARQAALFRPGALRVGEVAAEAHRVGHGDKA